MQIFLDKKENLYGSVLARTNLSLEEIARIYNPVLRGWINYYGRYHRSGLYPVIRHFNKTLMRWIMRKYKRYRGSKTRAGKFLQRIVEKELHLFEHWKCGMIGPFD